VQFNFPEWQETAPPVFQQLTPNAKTYTPGTEANDNDPAVDYITFGNSPTAAVPSAPVVPVNHIVIPSPAADTSNAGCEPEDFPAATSGANDDGSGTAWQLALAEQLAKRKFAPRNKVRFLWFGAAEDGLIGSQDYAKNMSDRDVANTDVMIDTDMIASPNYARLVYDGDGSEPDGTPGPDGSGTIENVFKRYFARRGMARQPIPFDGRSNYVGFVDRGIPSGGIFAGAEAPKTAEQIALFGGVEGEQLDPCYHEAATPSAPSPASRRRRR